MAFSLIYHVKKQGDQTDKGGNKPDYKFARNNYSSN